MDAATLIAGSTHIDRMRKEIDTVIRMILGFLNDEKVSEIALTTAEVVVRDRGVLKWTLGRNHLGLRVGFYAQFYEDLDYKLICDLPGNVPFKHVVMTHANLDDFVNGMEELFPSLREKWSPITVAARDNPSLVYELYFPIPENHQIAQNEGVEAVRYRKRATLALPLPIDTEVFFGIEDDYDEGYYFKVIGYRYQLHDQLGYLSEREVAMVLEIDEERGWPIENVDRVIKYLETNGWEWAEPA